MKTEEAQNRAGDEAPESEDHQSEHHHDAGSPDRLLDEALEHEDGESEDASDDLQGCAGDCHDVAHCCPSDESQRVVLEA